MFPLRAPAVDVAHALKGSAVFMTSGKTLARLLGVSAVMVGLAGCGSVAEDSANPYHDIEGQLLDFDNVEPKLKQELRGQYRIVQVDPVLPEDCLVFFCSSDDTLQQEWVDGFGNQSVEPAEVMVRTEEHDRYTYEVALDEGVATLYEIGASDTVPAPEELLRQELGGES